MAVSFSALMYMEMLEYFSIVPFVAACCSVDKNAYAAHNTAGTLEYGTTIPAAGGAIGSWGAPSLLKSNGVVERNLCLTNTPLFHQVYGFGMEAWEWSCLLSKKLLTPSSVHRHK